MFGRGGRGRREQDARLAEAMELSVALDRVRALARSRPYEAVDLATRLTALVRRDPTAPSSLVVEALVAHGTALGAAGRGSEAYAATQEAVRVARAAGDPEALATALGAHAHRCDDVGRWRDGRALHTEAVELRRGLAHGPDGRADLAVALDDLGLCLASLGEDGAALLAHEEAVALLRAGGPAAEPWLARALLNLTACHLGRADHGAALVTGREALALRARGDVSGDDADLAASLVNLAVALRMAGHWTEALAAQRDAVRTFEALAEEAPDVVDLLGDLARATGNLSLMLGETGDLDGCLDVGERSLALRERLGDQAELSGGLLNHSIFLREAGRTAEAARAAARAVELRRTLRRAEPRAWTVPLGNALAGLADVQVDLADLAGALASSRESVDLLRAAGGDPRAPRMLAHALDTRAAVLVAAGDPAGRGLTEQALNAFHVLAAANPAGVGGELATALRAAAERHRDDDPAAAQSWAAEAVEVLERLSGSEPAAHASALDESRGLLASLG